MEFDVNLWRSFITLLSLVLFVALMVWTLNKRRQQVFEDAAQLPFADDEPRDPPESK
jgi:cytochrome c oxidase cbb3-type subunit 4